MTAEREPPAPARQAGVSWYLWVLFLALATFTQIAFKWGGTDLEKVNSAQNGSACC